MSAPLSPFDSQAFIKSLTARPGVYRMYDAAGEILYVGKARNLKKRVSSYFARGDHSVKTQALLAQIHHIEVTVTHTEGEALLLENNLIKALQPRYNILLRDDKGYPYIHLSDDEFPRLSFYRGKRGGRGRYFGPYPSSNAVRESLSLMQKLFPVRQCDNTFYSNRSRACLQYQIKRCSGPCVGLVTRERYQEHVRHAVMFLEGKNSEVIDELVRRMEAAAAELDFETAAVYRDQIANLRRVQERQYVSGNAAADCDVIAVATAAGAACVQVFFIRGGHNLGNKTFYPRNAAGADPAELLGAFLSQHYLGDAQGERPIPPEILLGQSLEEEEALAELLTQQAGRRVLVSSRLRGERARWVEMARNNAEHALAAHLASKANLMGRFEALQEALHLEAMPQRIECFDISHTMGERTVASCVVFDWEGPMKSDYRRYNIEDITPGDDYAAMHQVLTRRFRRLQEGEGRVPDILLIDGGLGQVRQAHDVLEELAVAGILVVGVAKGPTRKAGLEQLVLSGVEAPTILPPESPALHLIQQVRDEAHRFAITGHRQRRAKARRTSSLENIPGLGPKRRQQLLRQFGGLQEVARAGVEDLAKVHGISRQLAQRIYDALHPE
ncbi:MAG: excinuclease ABC subunit UvrC [Thiohalomonadaceae bacterium]